MQTIEIGELDNKLTKEFPFDNSENIKHSIMPKYPAKRGYYLWYKDSIPEVIDTSIMSDEHKFLYQSDDLTENKSQLNIYVLVYSVFITIAILILLITPFVPEAFATSPAGKSSVIFKDGKDTITSTDQQSETKPNVETIRLYQLDSKQSPQMAVDLW